MKEIENTSFKMKPKEIIKRSYYALTVGIIMLCLNMSSVGWYAFPYKYLSFIVLLSLGICWVMTRHNKASSFKLYAGIIIGFSLLYLYFPMLVQISIFSDIFYGVSIGSLESVLKCIFKIVVMGCVIISTFLSNTKYYNILPNQPKGLSTLFRVLSWTGQIITWGFLILFAGALLYEMIINR